MEHQALEQTAPVAALTIEEALAGSQCPYCGETPKENPKEHLEACRSKSDPTPKPQWAYHIHCGKVMVLAQQDGLCLVENAYGRYVVPSRSLQCSSFSKVMEAIEEHELSIDEIEKLINILRIQTNDQVNIPKSPKLWPGCQVEVKMGTQNKVCTIGCAKGSMYRAAVDGKTINISPKHIIRIL